MTIIARLKTPVSPLKLLITTTCLLIILVSGQNSSYAQTEDNITKINPYLREQKLQSILVLPFNYQNISESLAHAYAEKLSLAILETGNFYVFTPQNVNDIFDQHDLDLVNCRQPACSIKVAKLLEANYIILGDLTLNFDDSFSLKYNIINANSQQIENSDIIIFNKEQLNQEFFKIASQVKERLPLLGKVLRFDDNQVLVNLGADFGLKLGDRLVTYHNPNQSPADNQDATKAQLDSMPANVLIIDQITEDNSLAGYQFSSGLINVGDKVKTYLNREKQIKLAEESRQVIDRFFQIPPQKNDQSPEVQKFESYLVQEELIDYAKIEWIQQVREYEDKREFYRWTTIGASIALALLYLADIREIWPYAIGLGAGGYSFTKFVESRSHVARLIDEGKFKGYLSQKWLPSSNNKLNNSKMTAVLLSYNFNF